MPEKITSWKTRDGKVHLEEFDADIHEAKLDLQDLIEKEIPYFDAKSQVKSFFNDHGSKIYKILQRIHEYDA